MNAFKQLLERATARPYKVTYSDDGDGGLWIEGPDPTQNVICDLIQRDYEQEYDAVDHANARLLTIGANHVEALVAALNALLDSDGSRGVFSLMKQADASEQSEALLAQIEKEAAQ